MPLPTFQGALQWVVSGYTLMFVAMLIEGPVVTAAAAFVAALGYLNVWIVLSLSLLGNIVPDAVYYAIGYWGRERFIDKYGHYFGFTKKKIRQLERMIEEHAGKALIAIKFIPFISTPGLIAAGASRMKLDKYILWSLILSIPSSLLYFLFGYYFGAAYDRVSHYLNIAFFVVGVIILLAIVGYVQTKLSQKLEKKLEKEEP